MTQLAREIDDEGLSEPFKKIFFIDQLVIDLLVNSVYDSDINKKDVLSW
ncbi:hypothetical protein QY903_06610 [Lactiplantibacillus paraplantarum]